MWRVLGTKSGYLAVFFTLLAVAVTFDSTGVRWLWHEQPGVGWTMAAVAGALWLTWVFSLRRGPHRIPPQS